MEHLDFDIQVYVNNDGISPFYEWLNSIKDKKYRARIYARIDKLAFGHFGDFKSVGNGVFELRLTFGPGFRIYFCFNVNRVLLLLMGGDKSSQSKDILQAKRLYIEYCKGKRE